MSTDTRPTRPPTAYTGPYRYADWTRDYLGVTLSEAQRDLMRAVAEHRLVHVESGNGLGKSYAVACLSMAFLFTNYPSTVYATSGTYPKLRRTLCKPIKKLHGDAKERARLPGRYKESPPRIEFEQDPEWYLEAARPKDPDELEGPHNDYLLAIVEEADKESVNSEVIESMQSTLTDENDRMIVIGNPPRDEANVVADLADSDAWHTLRFDSFDSQNVQVSAGNYPGPKLPGLVDLQTLKDDYEAWNGEPWPGYEEARSAVTIHDDGTVDHHRDDLDVRWYRRRLGVMPPEGAAEHRPIYADDVSTAFEMSPSGPDRIPEALGLDVARSGDRTILVGKYPDQLRVLYNEPGTDHVAQEAAIREFLDDWPPRPLAIDAIGEGSGLADRLQQAYSQVVRFDAGSKPADPQTYRNCRSEALHELGKWLRDGGTFSNRRLREELLTTARATSFESKHLASRSGTVLSATSKDATKDILGRSPDAADAAMMAVWVDAVDAPGGSDFYGIISG